jgi:uncharacterized glyoxalase superfamily protein PhnB
MATKSTKNAKARKPARGKSAAKSAAKSKSRRSAAKAAPPKKMQKKAAPKKRFTSHAPSLTVDDVHKSLAWYCDVLGFTIKQKWEHGGQLRGGELELGDVVLYIGQDDWQKGRDRKKGEGLRLYWYTNQDIDKLADAIKSRGGSLESEPKDEWGTRSFNLVDPTGYRITIGSER